MQSGFEIADVRQDELDNFLPVWQQLLSQQSNHYQLYQSPEWWEHLVSTGHGESGVLLRLMQEGQVVGILPMQQHVQQFRMFPWGSAFSRVSLACTEVLGGQPLISADEHRVARLYESLFARYKNIQAIYFKSVPKTSDWYDLLIRGAARAKDSFAHVAREESFHYLTLPPSFDEFLQRFSKKKRYNLKRQLRLMEEAYHGKLRFECITTPDRVDAFLAASETVAGLSWKDDRLTRALARNEVNRARYTDLASRGLLRAYVLSDDQRPVAYALGYQYGNTYHYSDISYAENESQLSPGTVLLFLIVRDLIENSTLQQVNFGITDASYKRQFANEHTRDRSIWIFRSTIRNRLVSLLQSGSQSAARLARLARERLSAGQKGVAAD